MQAKADDKTRFRRESLQLRRLSRMIDVVQAIVIWRIFILLPSPTAEQLSWADAVPEDRYGQLVPDLVSAKTMGF